MKLLPTLHFNFEKGVAAAIGNFDGVHRGHQALLSTLAKQADRMQLPVVVVLFEPQPGEYFHKNTAPARLMSLREKLEVLKKYHVDYVFCLKFNQKIAEMSPENFAKYYFFDALHTKYLLIGEDFRFGQQRRGDSDLLKKMAKEEDCIVEVIPDVLLGKERISSTLIRQRLARGDLTGAASLLGRPYSLCGRVIKGAGLGKQWGIPTANLNSLRRSFPLRGVFCVKIKIKNQWWDGIANLGNRPTVDGVNTVVEVHLFNMDKNLYGEMVHIFFLHKLRDEIKFPTANALVDQIHRDIIEAKAEFKSRLNFLATASISDFLIKE